MLHNGGWLVTLYGCDTTTTGNFPLTTVVTALTTLVSVALRISDAGNKPVDEGETKEYCNHVIQGYPILRENIALKVLPTKVQTTSLQTLLPVDFLKKKYKWINWGSYPIKDVNCGSAQVQAITLSPDDYGVTYEDGWVTYTITAKARGTL